MSGINKKPTINDVAEALGVSKTTVSRAISGKGRIGTDTRERVLEYIKEHDYKPNAVAKGLAQSRTYNIGVVLPKDNKLVDSSFFNKCLVGISEYASTLDYDVLIAIVSSNDISQLIRIIENGKVDGVVLTRTIMKDLPAEYLKSKGIPFVTIGTSTDNEVIQIDNDHRSACKELTSILLMKGMRRIGLIGGSETHVVTGSRYKGFEDAHIEQKVSLNKELVFLNVENSVMTETVMEDLLENKVDCIICMDDTICAYVLNKLKKENIRVPEDIKVASFYNSTILENNIPTITSLKFEPKELGMVSCKTLMEVMEGKNVNNRTLLNYELILKESTK